jgi:CRISPR/Cas system-associated exonuclease Cas4 (RecB family)
MPHKINKIQSEKQQRIGIRYCNQNIEIIKNNIDFEEPEVILNMNEEKLLQEAKKVLGLQENKLVFIGMANLAKYYWCAWHSYLKSIEREVGFFEAYLEDILQNAQDLGLLDKIPNDVKDILEIGNIIQLRDIHNLLKKCSVVYPTKKTKKEITKHLLTEHDPMKKGEYYQILFAEKYPSIRWNYRYKDIIVIGVPDGITESFAYEFKYTSKKKDLERTKRTAELQADLYGYFFNLPNKRVQIYCEEEKEVYTYVSLIKHEEVNDLFMKWAAMINGELPKKPMPWKCIKCEYKKKCNLR